MFVFFVSSRFSLLILFASHAHVPVSDISDRMNWLERSLQSRRILSICKLFADSHFSIGTFECFEHACWFWCFADESNLICSNSDLSSNNLTGTIPDLSSFNVLRNLYLKDNRLTGTIPSFPDPSSLNYVLVFSIFQCCDSCFRFFWFFICSDFSFNSLTGSIPNIQNQSNLNTL